MIYQAIKEAAQNAAGMAVWVTLALIAAPFACVGLLVSGAFGVVVRALGTRKPGG